MLNISSVQVRKYERQDTRVRGVASVMLDGCFIVRDIRIIQGDEGLFLAMPSRKLENGEYMDIAHPINADTRKIFEDAIFEEYNKTELYDNEEV